MLFPPASVVQIRLLIFLRLPLYCSSYTDTFADGVRISWKQQLLSLPFFVCLHSIFLEIWREIFLLLPCIRQNGARKKTLRKEESKGQRESFVKGVCNTTYLQYYNG